MKKTIQFKTIPVSSMRKLAIGAWNTPNNPSVSVELMLNITHLLHGLPKNIQLKHALIKLFSNLLQQVPELNTVIIRRKLRQRLTNRIFIPTVFRHRGQLDLNGIFIDDAYQLSLSQIKAQMDDKVRQLRLGNNSQINRVVSFFKACPSILCKPIMGFLRFIHYSCNMSLSIIGLPDDPFGSLTLTLLDKFDVRHAHIPLYSFSKSPITIAIGAKYKDNDQIILPITVTFDHRHFDGYSGSKAYKHLKKWIKNPNLVL